MNDQTIGDAPDAGAAMSMARYRGMLEQGPVYPDYANPDLLESIPLAARTVLDVGCAGGALGQAYLRRNPRARVLGIDLDPDAAARARTRLTEVACIDVEATPMPFAVPEGLDAIVYGDVLEHLRDPWTVLAAHAGLVNPGGVVVVCMPNIEHWSFIHRLLTGAFGYDEQGLFDRTHLRWFTPRTMGAALRDAGLDLCDIRPRAFDPAPPRSLADLLAPALLALGVAPEDYLNRAGPLQFIWRARKAAPERIALDATALPPLGGVSEVRVTEPLRALATDPAILPRILAEPELRPHVSDCPRIAILHRPLLVADAGIARIRALLAQDYVIVTEFDDHPSFVAARGVPVESLLTFRAVHAVQTSTAALGAALAAENPEIGVFPNAIFELPEPQNFADPDRLTVFFGALNREADWLPYIGVLNDVAAIAGRRIAFQVVHDRGFFDALTAPHKDFVPTCDYPAYRDLLARAEIALMPLTDTAFNRAKSDLKFIEAAAHRVCALASPTAYDASIQDGDTGLVFRDPAELRGNLLRLLAYPDAALGIAEAARRHVAAERMAAYQVAARVNWYRALWARRDELNASLRARVPELFA
jgi:2-polyprenyl-3-methyl-5-hydroxy-6-metoxy-1,4-benzoquinol methylase